MIFIRDDSIVLDYIAKRVFDVEKYSNLGEPDQTKILKMLDILEMEAYKFSDTEAWKQREFIKRSKTP